MAHFAQHENDSDFAPCHTARLCNVKKNGVIPCPHRSTLG